MCLSDSMLAVECAHVAGSLRQGHGRGDVDTVVSTAPSRSTSCSAAEADRDSTIIDRHSTIIDPQLAGSVVVTPWSLKLA